MEIDGGGALPPPTAASLRNDDQLGPQQPPSIPIGPLCQGCSRSPSTAARVTLLSNVANPLEAVQTSSSEGYSKPPASWSTSASGNNRVGTAGAPPRWPAAAGSTSQTCSATTAATGGEPVAAAVQHLLGSPSAVDSTAAQPARAAVAVAAAGRDVEGGQILTPVQGIGDGEGVWSGASPGAPSFAQILLKSTLPPSIQVAVHPPEVTDSGEPMASFSGEEMQLSCRPLSFTVLAKTPKGRPPFPEIRAHLALRFRFTADFIISPYDSAHLLIRCGNQEDYLKLLLKESMYIYGKPFRFLKWDWNFSPETDSPLVPVWLELPRLPANFYCEPMIRSIAGSIGPVLQIDKSTLNMTKTHAAVVCVQLDVSKRLHDRVRINLPAGGFWQAIHYPDPPLYCLHCNRLGHAVSNCRQRARPDGVRRNVEMEGQNEPQGAKPTVHEPAPPHFWRPVKQTGRTNCKQGSHVAPKGGIASAQSEFGDVGVGVSNPFEALTGLNSDDNALGKGVGDAALDMCINALLPDQNTRTNTPHGHACKLVDELPPLQEGGDSCSNLSSSCLGVSPPPPQADLLSRNCGIMGIKQIVDESSTSSTTGSTEIGPHTTTFAVQNLDTSPPSGEHLVASRLECNPSKVDMSPAPTHGGMFEGDTTQQPSGLQVRSEPAAPKLVHTAEDLHIVEEHDDAEASLFINSVAKPDVTEQSPSKEEEQPGTNPDCSDRNNADKMHDTGGGVIIALPVMYDLISLPGLPPPDPSDLPQAHMAFAGKSRVVINQRVAELQPERSPPSDAIEQCTPADTLLIRAQQTTTCPVISYMQAVTNQSPSRLDKACQGGNAISSMASLHTPTRPTESYSSASENSISPVMTDEEQEIMAMERQRNKKKKGHSRPFKMRSGLRRPRPAYRVGEDFMS